MQKQPPKRSYPALTLLLGLLSVGFFLGWDFVYNSPDMLPKPKRAGAQQVGTVVIDPAWLPCREDSDCVSMDTKCSNCCGYEGINISSIDEFSGAKEKLCRGWQGGVCECYNPKTKPVCVSGSCALTMEEQKSSNESPGTPQTRPKPVEP